MTRRRWRQIEGRLVEIDIKTGQPVGADEPPIRSHGVSVFQEVIAPDGTRIASRDAMRDYENRTGMTNDLDSLRTQTRRELNRANEVTKPKKDPTRIPALLDAFERASSSGYSRRPVYDE